MIALTFQSQNTPLNQSSQPSWKSKTKSWSHGRGGGCRELHIGNMQLWKILLSSDALLFAPRAVVLEEIYEDEDITFDFEGTYLRQLASVEYLSFFPLQNQVPANQFENYFILFDLVLTEAQSS